ncbi:hypothetical protein [Pseudomonas cichorii]|uniref:hypothetical protein n=1 Tax=Pseudomonas cichorii TaxID=36746 RepID=UPI000EFDFDAA|nr:hypothetical protein [Pseudomonas cichorii]
MRISYRLLVAILLFVMAWVCLFFAGDGVPENSSDLSDTRGLPAVTIYTVMLQAISGVALLLATIGFVVSARFESSSWGKRVAVFSIFNICLLLTSIVGVFVIGSFLFEKTLGLVGILLYLAVIALVISALPKRSQR